MIKSLRITLSILFLATLATSQADCPGNDDDALNCEKCFDDDTTLCFECAEGYKFEFTVD